MKNIIALLFSFCLLTGWAFSQNGVTYDIHPGSKYQVQALEDGLSLGDLTKYRKETERAKLLFDDDSIVELYSANELMGKGIEVEMDYISRSQLPMLNLFRLHDDGWLIEDASPISKEETMVRLEKIRN